LRDTFVAALSRLAEENPLIMLLTGDLGFGVLGKFAARFPRQYLNVGVAEQNLTGLATGLALEGRVVFTYSIGNFPTLRCLEQIRNDVCYHDVDVKVVSIGAGFSYGSLGISHHATEDISILRALPNMTVVSPCDLWEVAEATRALVDRPGPAVLRLDKSTALPTARPGDVFRIGRARLVRNGLDMTLVATGGILGEVLQAADALDREGVSCRVLSVHTIKPLDVESLEAAAAETGGIVTVEEHTVDGGLGGAVAENLLERGAYPRCFLRIGLRSGFSCVVGSQAYLRKVYGMDAAAIADAVRAKVLGEVRGGGPKRALAG
jgi:transketolase